MNPRVAPGLAIAAILALVVILGFFGYRAVAGPSRQASNSIGSGKIDLSKVKQDDLDDVKKQIEKASETRSGTAK